MNEQIPSTEPPTAESESKTGLKDKVRETKETLKSKTKEIVEQAKQRGEEYVEQNKERAAQRIGGVGETIRQSAERLEKENDPNIAHYTRLVAEKLEGAASFIRERDLTQLRQEGEDIARRHPAAFFGGMFVAGLAVSRFFKASAEHAMGGENRDERRDEQRDAPEQQPSAAQGMESATSSQL
jgi:gas vesicle protein